MTSGSLLPMMRLISSRADLTLKSECVISSDPDDIDTQFNVLFSAFAILNVFSRYPSSASCVVTATACSRDVVSPEILLGTCRSVVLGRSSLTSRGSLFVVILRLLSDPSKLRVTSVRSRLPSSRHRHQHDPHHLLESRLVRVHSLPLSSCQCSSQRSWSCWVVCLTLMIPRVRLTDGVSGPALRPSRFSRDGKRHWASSVCLSLLDPLSHAVQLRRPAHD